MAYLRLARGRLGLFVCSGEAFCNLSCRSFCGLWSCRLSRLLRVAQQPLQGHVNIVVLQLQVPSIVSKLIDEQSSASVQLLLAIIASWQMLAEI